MLQQIIWLLHMGCAVFIIILVLLQHGKGAEMGAAIGAGASQTIFGSKGSGSFLTKITTIFALIFAITSISLSFFIKNTKKSKISDLIVQQELALSGNNINIEDNLDSDFDYNNKKTASVIEADGANQVVKNSNAVKDAKAAKNFNNSKSNTDTEENTEVFRVNAEGKDVNNSNKVGHKNFNKSKNNYDSNSSEDL